MFKYQNEKEKTFFELIMSNMFINNDLNFEFY